MKIRLVEDSYIERHKIGSYLTDWGLDHVDVGTGTEAIKLLEAPDPPKMALLDWMLPGAGRHRRVPPHPQADRGRHC